MNDTAQALFDYLRDMLYYPEKATLDLDSLDPDFRQVGEGLVYFAQCLSEQKALAKALARGDLSDALPPPSNELAAPLKALHAALKHLTWQTQRVAAGDYRQRIDFMGEFAEAFNSMIKQLDQRQSVLEQEIELSHQKTEALEQSYGLLEAITERYPQWMIVKDRQSGAVLFANEVAHRAMERDPQLESTLDKQLKMAFEAGRDAADPDTPIDIMVNLQDGVHYFSVYSYMIQWRGQEAFALVFSDISQEKEAVRQLENYAYQDQLTGLNNRFFGMQTLREWVDEKRVFCLCFIDLDSLKYVNDTYGHGEGDIYIKEVAELLLRFAPDAVVFRLGGDEFMVMAEGFTHMQAKKRMDELRAQLDMGRPVDGGGTQLVPYQRSVSYGIVEVGADNEMPISELLGLADERMYRYKRAHKNERKDAIALGPWPAI